MLKRAITSIRRRHSRAEYSITQRSAPIGLLYTLEISPSLSDSNGSIVNPCSRYLHASSISLSNLGVPSPVIGSQPLTAFHPAFGITGDGSPAILVPAHPVDLPSVILRLLEMPGMVRIDLLCEAFVSQLVQPRVEKPKRRLPFFEPFVVDESDHCRKYWSSRTVVVSLGRNLGRSVYLVPAASCLSPWFMMGVFCACAATSGNPRPFLLKYFTNSLPLLSRYFLMSFLCHDGASQYSENPPLEKETARSGLLLSTPPTAVT